MILSQIQQIEKKHSSEKDHIVFVLVKVNFSSFFLFKHASKNHIWAKILQESLTLCIIIENQIQDIGYNYSIVGNRILLKMFCQLF